jgi:hypothetical protein
MDDDAIKRLRELAERARDDDPSWYDEDGFELGIPRAIDRKFCAAAAPDVVTALLDERDAAMALLRQARYFVESDVAMMDAISRHAPLPFEDQARHDATEYPSERLLKRIDALLGDGGEGR